MKIPKIISGGQTGADRGTLDWAISHDLPHGRWCPKGRRAEDGIIPAIYKLEETPSEDYEQRTEWNVRDSDVTVIFTQSMKLEGGSKQTAEFARIYRKPCLHLPPSEDEVEQLKRFLEAHQPGVLNVAGERASSVPGLADRVKQVLEKVFFETSN